MALVSVLGPIITNPVLVLTGFDYYKGTDIRYVVLNKYTRL